MNIRYFLIFLVVIGAFWSCNKLEDDVLVPNAEVENLKIQSQVISGNSSFTNILEGITLPTDQVLIEITENPKNGIARLTESAMVMYHPGMESNNHEDSLKCVISGDGIYQEVIVRYSINDSIPPTDSASCVLNLGHTFLVNKNIPLFVDNTDSIFSDLPCLQDLVDLDSFEIVEPPRRGDIEILNPPFKSFIYTPDSNFVGLDLLIAEIKTVTGDSSIFMGIAFNVVSYADSCSLKASNDYFYLNPSSDSTVFNILENDSLCNNSVLSVQIISGSTIGSTHFIDSNFNLHYIPPTSHNSILDSLSYEVCLNNEWCDQATTVFYFSPDTCFVEARSDSVVVNRSQEVIIDILANDENCEKDWDLSSFNLLEKPDNGSVLTFLDGKLRYTSTSDVDITSELMIYQICDVNQECASATIKVAIE